jgi:PAS domain S-box-containing protein
MLSKQYQLIIVTIIAAITMLLAAWTVHSRIQQRIEQSVGDSLSTVLHASHESIKRWAEQEQAIVETWSDNLNVRRLAESLLDTARDRETLLASPAQQQLRQQLLPILAVKGYRGYFIIDRDSISLASSRDVNVGSLNLLAEQHTFLERIWSGYTAMSQPLSSDVPLPEAHGEQHQLRNTSMFVGAPILNNRYEVIAVFVFRIDPHQVFTQILQQGRIGESGETYAFNKSGQMLSLSRFDEQLHNIGIIAGEGDDMRHVIEIRDPGVNLLAGEESPLERALQPFTLMTQQTLAKRDGMNLKGYRDYRGVRVLGTWLWDEELQMGFTTEIDEKEAKEVARYAGYAIVTFASLLILLLICLIIIFDRGRQVASRQSRELHAIIDAAPVAMVLTDKQGNIDFFNRSFIQHYGWTTEDIRTPEQWWQAAYPDSDYRLEVQQGWEKAVLDAQQNNSAIAPQQWSLTCKNGMEKETEFRMVPVSENLSVIAMIDLTERNRAMRTIRFERDRAQSYLDTVDVMIVALDPNGTITQINRAGCELLGYEEEELIGRNWFDTCLPPDERQRLMEEVHLPAMTQASEQTPYVENEVLTRGGVRRLIAWRNTQLFYDNGNTVGSLSAGSDITEIRAAERERAQLFEQLQRSQKAEAIGQLSAGVSHNFNNMFASIIGFLGLAIRKAEDDTDADMKRYLSEALSSSHRARDLVAQIASFSRSSAADIRRHELDSVLPISMALLNNILPSAFKVELNIAHDLPPVRIDEEQFQQAMANLISNASDAMEGSGVIEISARLERVESGCCNSCAEVYAGDYVVVAVEDSGHGIEPQLIEHIFEPFFTTKEVGQGTGMGLPVVHGIVHKIGGHIQVVSTAGKGTLVSLYLPVHDASSA